MHQTGRQIPSKCIHCWQVEEVVLMLTQFGQAEAETRNVVYIISFFFLDWFVEFFFQIPLLLSNVTINEGLILWATYLEEIKIVQIQFCNFRARVYAKKILGKRLSPYEMSALMAKTSKVIRVISTASDELVLLSLAWCLWFQYEKYEIRSFI